MHSKNTWTFCALFLISAVWALAAGDTVTGTLSVDSKPVTLKYIYARYAEDPFDETRQNLVLTLTDVPLSPEILQDQFALSDQSKSGKLHLVEITIDDQNKIIASKILHNAWDSGGVMKSGTGVDAGPITIGPKSAKGKISLSDDMFDHKYEVISDFNVALPEKIAKKAPSGNPLPAGGGDPGKAYMAYCKAMETADVNALRSLVIAERAKDLDRPEIKDMLPMMKELRAKEIKITGGTADATNAWLQVTGKDPGGTVSTGEVEMKLEDGKWKLVKESWKSKM